MQNIIRKNILVIGPESACADFITEQASSLPEHLVLMGSEHEHGIANAWAFKRAYDADPDDFLNYSGLIVLGNERDRSTYDPLLLRYFGFPILFVLQPSGGRSMPAIPATPLFIRHKEGRPISKHPHFKAFAARLSHLMFVAGESQPLPLSSCVYDDFRFGVQMQHVVLHHGLRKDFDAVRAVIGEQTLETNNGKDAAKYLLHRVVGLTPTEISGVLNTHTTSVRSFLESNELVPHVLSGQWGETRVSRPLTDTVTAMFRTKAAPEDIRSVLEAEVGDYSPKSKGRRGACPVHSAVFRMFTDIAKEDGSLLTPESVADLMGMVPKTARRYFQAAGIPVRDGRTKQPVQAI